MAVNLTVDRLKAAMRLGPTAEETTRATELLEVATQLIRDHLRDAYDDAPASLCSEAAIRIASYLYDQPHVARGPGLANAGRNSGAWRLLLRYRLIGAGSTKEAAEAATEAGMGSVENPVVNVSVSGSTLTVEFADGSTRDETLPAGGTGGTDQTARAAAAAAQATANTALSTANANVRPMPATPAEAAGGTSTTIRGWTAALIRAAINAVVPTWARTGNAATLPANKIRDRSLIARMFAVGAVDHNALAADSVRRAAILAEAVDSGKLDPAVAARLLPAVTAADNAKVLTVVSGAWAAADAAGGGATAATVLHESTPTAASPTLSLSRALTAADNNRQLMISVRHVDTGMNQDLVGALIADVEHVLAGSAMLRHDNDASPLNFTAVISSAHDSITPTFGAATTGSQTRYVKITLR